MSADLAETVADLAHRLPAEDLHQLAGAAVDGVHGLRSLRADAAGAALRQACDRLVAQWPARPDAGPWVAGAISGAAAVAVRQAPTAEVVWTGPVSKIDTSRLTAPVVADIIDGAMRDVWLVSYATVPDPQLTDAVADAVARGVEVTLVAERHADNADYRAHRLEAFPGLPVRRLGWPAGHRRAGAALHAKLIVADRAVALVGSANLTGRAMVDNLECGVLLRGGSRPGAIVDHLQSLLFTGVLTPVR